MTKECRHPCLCDICLSARNAELNRLRDAMNRHNLISIEDVQKIIEEAKKLQVRYGYKYMFEFVEKKIIGIGFSHTLQTEAEKYGHKTA